MNYPGEEQTFRFLLQQVQYLYNPIYNAFLMQQNLEGLEIHDLQILLINKNREFTDAMKMGKKHKELVPIYEGIKEIYQAITSHKGTLRSLY